MLPCVARLEYDADGKQAVGVEKFSNSKGDHQNY